MANIGDFNKNMTSIASCIRVAANVEQTSKLSVTSMISTLLNLDGYDVAIENLSNYLARHIGEFVFPVKAQSIGMYAFAGCYDLSVIHSANGIHYDKSAFYSANQSGSPNPYTVTGGTYNKGETAPPRVANGTGELNIPAAVRADLLGRTYTTFDDHFYGLASAIRAVTGGTELLTIPDMVTEINTINLGTQDIFAAVIDRTITKLDLSSEYNISEVDDYSLCGCSNLSTIIARRAVSFGYRSLSGCHPDLHISCVDYTYWNESALGASGSCIPVTYLGSPIADVQSENYIVTSYNPAGYTDLVTTSQTIPKGQLGIYAGYSDGYAIKSLDFLNVSYIGSKTFSRSHNLASVNLEGVSIVGNEAFAFCSKLSTVVWPTTGTLKLFPYSFEFCQLGSVLDLPATVSIFGQNVFQYCSNIVSVIIRGGNDSLGGAAFENCTNLTTVSILANIKRIGYHAFGHTQLSSIVVPQSLSAIEDWAFEYCSHLSSITFPQSLKFIGEGAFYETNLSGTLDLSNTQISAIGGRAFDGCTRLTKVLLPATLRCLNYSAFDDCAGLNSQNTISVYCQKKYIWSNGAWVNGSPGLDYSCFAWLGG